MEQDHLPVREGFILVMSELLPRDVLGRWCDTVAALAGSSGMKEPVVVEIEPAEALSPPDLLHNVDMAGGGWWVAFRTGPDVSNANLVLPEDIDGSISLLWETVYELAAEARIVEFPTCLHAGHEAIFRRSGVWLTLVCPKTGEVVRRASF